MSICESVCLQGIGGVVRVTQQRAKDLLYVGVGGGGVARVGDIYSHGVAFEAHRSRFPLEAFWPNNGAGATHTYAVSNTQG